MQSAEKMHNSPCDLILVDSMLYYDKFRVFISTPAAVLQHISRLTNQGWRAKHLLKVSSSWFIAQKSSSSYVTVENSAFYGSKTCRSRNYNGFTGRCILYVEGFTSVIRIYQMGELCKLKLSSNLKKTVREKAWCTKCLSNVVIKVARCCFDHRYPRRWHGKWRLHYCCLYLRRLADSCIVINY